MIGRTIPSGRAKIMHPRPSKREWRGIKLCRGILLGKNHRRKDDGRRTRSHHRCAGIRTNLRLQLYGFLALSLTACNPLPETVTKCEYEVRRAYPTDEMVEGLMSSRMQRLMRLCMKNEGYELAAGEPWASEDCKVGVGWTEESNPYVNGACYEYHTYYDLAIWLSKRRRLAR
jgi:hypothetical protein